MHLLRVQKKHLEEEHELRIAHLCNQLREERVRRAGLRLRLAFQLFIGPVATVIRVGILLLLRHAFASRQIVGELDHARSIYSGRAIGTHPFEARRRCCMLARAAVLLLRGRCGASQTEAGPQLAGVPE